jgi:hypothetical protein
MCEKFLPSIGTIYRYKNNYNSYLTLDLKFQQKCFSLSLEKLVRDERREKTCVAS